MKRKMHMIRMAVSGLGIGLNVNHYVNFAGQNSRKNNDDTEGSPVEYNRRSNNLAKALVVVLMVMSSPMMNAKISVANLTEGDGAKTEMVEPILIDLENLDEAITIVPDCSNPQNAQTKAPFGVTSLLGDKIHHFDTFKINGKKYYIVYSGINNSEYVDRVSFFREGFKAMQNGVQLPVVQELVYHDLGKAKEYCGIIVRTTQRLKSGEFKITKEEVRLPDNCAQILIDLLANYSKMKNRTSIEYSETKSPQLRQTKVEIY